MSDPAPAIAIVYTLFGDEAAAKEAARDAVDAGLAACANLLGPCRSLYMWAGERREEAEWPVIFKTALPLRDRLIDRIAARHSYDVPAISSWTTDAVLPAYADWVGEVTKAP